MKGSDADLSIGGRGENVRKKNLYHDYTLIYIFSPLSYISFNTPFGNFTSRC